jgi:hypothetical protein
MKITDRMIKSGSSRWSILGVVLIIVLGALPLSGQAVQKTICNPMDLNYDYRNYGAAGTL